MPPSASILFPTRRRPGYLAVALRSVAAQAAAHGAEIVVVEDGEVDPETERLATEHGARYLALGAERGINVARNAAVEAAAADLLCFIDDDVEAWPGWLAAMLEGARRNPGHEALGGPIRPRLRPRAAAGHQPGPRCARHRRRFRVGLEPHDPAFGDRADRRVRRGAPGRRR
jgi:glycosyltransferase involved in cell wall biosynthesis